MRTRRTFTASLAFLAILGLTVMLQAQPKAPAAKGKTKAAEVASTPPADAEFTRYGIYESTAPRAKAATPVITELPLKLKKGDRIALVGNGLLERAQDHGYLEALLQQKFPHHNLSVRNLAWAADEVGLMPRPANFADLEQHLVHEKTDVILATFGFNESFAGEAGLPAFKQKLAAFVARMKTKAFNGTTAPRIVLISPVANENAHGVPAAKNNAILRLYTDAMREVAKAEGVAFIDVFEPTLAAMADAKGVLTHNGAHLTEKGHKVFAEAVYKAALGETPPEPNASLRAAIVDKDRQFFRRYRPLNTFYYTGGRNKEYGYLD